MFFIAEKIWRNIKRNDNMLLKHTFFEECYIKITLTARVSNDNMLLKHTFFKECYTKITLITRVMYVE